MSKIDRSFWRLVNGNLDRRHKWEFRWPNYRSTVYIIRCRVCGKQP